jgi:hypothetical protein
MRDCLRVIYQKLDAVRASCIRGMTLYDGYIKAKNNERKKEKGGKLRHQLS